MPDMDVPTRTPIYDVQVWLRETVDPVVVRKNLTREVADRVLTELSGNLSRHYWYGLENNSVAIMSSEDATHFLSKDCIIRAGLVRSTRQVIVERGYGYGGYWIDEELFLETLEAEEDCA